MGAKVRGNWEIIMMVMIMMMMLTIMILAVISSECDTENYNAIGMQHSCKTCAATFANACAYTCAHMCVHMCAYVCTYLCFAPVYCTDHVVASSASQHSPPDNTPRCVA